MHDTMVLPVWRRAQAFAASVHSASARWPTYAAPQRVHLRRAVTGLVSAIGDGAAAKSPLQCARHLQLAVNATGDVERHFDTVTQHRTVPLSLITSLHVELTVMRRMLIAARRRVLESVTAS